MKILIYFGLLLLIGLASCAEKKVVCYYGSWATYRHGNGKFGIENINPHLCTHIIYSFLGISQDGALKVLDPYLDLEENWGRGNIKKFINLKTVNPKLKLMFAVGGWNEGSLSYSIVARDAAKRQRFANDVLQFCINHGFDGFDLDWEYPGQRDGDISIDKTNFISLLKDLNSKLAPKNLLLSVAVAAAESSASISYDVPSISRYVDFINLMTYDLHGPWDDALGLNAPLYQGHADQTSFEKQLNVNASVHYWLKSGAPKSKLILGLPMYGRTFTLRDSSQITVGSYHNGPGVGGPYTDEPGFIGYNEICEKQLTEHWLRNWEPNQQAPYISLGNQWIGYDDIESTTLKANFIIDLDLAGAMIWSIETDDFVDACGKGKFPLLSVIRTIMQSQQSVTTTTAASTTVTTTVAPSTSVTTTTQAPESEFTCTSNGLFRDPVNCSKFYMCVGQNMYPFSCPNGLLFDVAQNACNWPDQVNC